MKERESSTEQVLTQTHSRERERESERERKERGVLKKALYKFYRQPFLLLL